MPSQEELNARFFFLFSFASRFQRKPTRLRYEINHRDRLPPRLTTCARALVQNVQVIDRARLDEQVPEILSVLFAKLTWEKYSLDRWGTCVRDTVITHRPRNAA